MPRSNISIIIEEWSLSCFTFNVQNCRFILIFLIIFIISYTLILSFYPDIANKFSFDCVSLAVFLRNTIPFWMSRNLEDTRDRFPWEEQRHISSRLAASILVPAFARTRRKSEDKEN